MLFFRRILLHKSRTWVTSGCSLSKSAISVAARMRKLSFGEYTLLALPVTTFCLGTWQVKRRSWKLGLIKELEEKTFADPVDFPDELNMLSQMEYMKVKVRGTFDHTKELYIGPRSLISNETESGSVFSRAPQSGFHVITPFHLHDRDLTILVNRGWVSRENISPLKRKGGQIEDEIELVGTVRLQEKRPPFLPKSTKNGKYFSYRDLDQMAILSDASPILIDADYHSTVPDGPIGGQTRVTLRNEHLSYIITWYSLSAALFWMWYKRFGRRIKIM